MARSDARYSVYPTPKAIEVVGNSSPVLNQAVECWAAQLARATADNSGKFLKSFFEDLGQGRSNAHYVHDWGILADALKSMKFDPDFANPSYLLASAVEDGHRLHGLGTKWLAPDLDFDCSPEAGPAVYKLVEELKKLDYAHAWAIIVAVQWYWENHDKIGKDDEWWTLAYRRDVTSNKSQKRGRRQKPVKSQDASFAAGGQGLRPRTRSRKGT